MSDWLLEMMEATAAEVESEREKELQAKASSQSSNDKPANDDDGFIACKDGNSSGARGPNIILYNTVVKAVELDRLVWAKCIYYKGNKPFFPARICDNSEGALLSPKEIGNEWPIPPTKALVQYISLTKKPHNTYEYALLEKSKDIIPYDKPLDKRQSGSLDVIEIRPKKNKNTSSKGEWNAENIENMYEVLSKTSGFKHADAKYIKEQIMTVANAFLEQAIPVVPLALPADSPSKSSTRSPSKSPTRSPSRSPTRNAKKIQEDDDDGDIVALATKLNSNPTETLVAGDWIAYFNHVFREHTVFTRIKEVIPSNSKRPLVLENGDLIAMTDSIRKCQPANEAGDECIKDSGFYNELRYYKLKKSKVGDEDKEMKKENRNKNNRAKNSTPTDSDSQVTASPTSSKKRRLSNTSGSESQSSSQSRFKRSR